jgi:hypothetical protein
MPRRYFQQSITFGDDMAVADAVLYPAIAHELLALDYPREHVFPEE